jgi:hypothetical protein
MLEILYCHFKKIYFDAMAVQLRKTMAVSIYPKEANPLWEKPLQ